MTETREVRLTRMQVANLGYECINLDFKISELKASTEKVSGDPESTNELLNRIAVVDHTATLYRLISADVRRGQIVEASRQEEDKVMMAFPDRGHSLVVGTGVVDRMFEVIYGPVPDIPPIVSQSPLRSLVISNKMPKERGYPELGRELYAELVGGVKLFFRPGRGVMDGSTLVKGFPLDRPMKTPEERRYIIRQSQTNLSDWNDNYNAQQRRAWADFEDHRMTR